MNIFNLNLYKIIKFFILFFSFICCIFLYSCSSIYFFGTSALVVERIVNKRTFYEQIYDEKLKFNIVYSLAREGKLNKYSRIMVVVYNKCALLVGQNKNFLSVNKIIKIVKNVKEIKKVYNRIQIISPIKLIDILEDLLITLTINIKFFFSDINIFSNVKVVTENKNVFLLGEVSYYEASKIINFSTNIFRVKKVVDLFDYLN